jgi:dolichyl-phosphate-mannose-protein mannosyltransferase
VTVVTARAETAGRPLADRLLAAVPLLSIFLWLSIVYAIEAWAHGTPWLFGDELELTQLSRSIADTGHAARRGEAHSFNTLWTFAMAPAWLIDNVHTAYTTVKYLAVIVMTLTVFPAYALARLVVGKRPALFVAAAAAVIPAMAYSAMIVEEPLAYPYSTLCLFLILRVLIAPSRWWIGAALLASAIAPLIRGELAVVPVVFLLAAIFLAWQSAWISRWRSSWTAWDWVGLAVLLVGAGVILSAFLGHHSYEWLIATGFYKDRMFDLGLDAAGALTIGLGILPVVAGLASLWRAPGEPRTREVSSFRCVLLAAIVAFGLYTSVKTTYVSTTFGTYTYERNLIYLAPLLFAGTALWLERRRIHPVAVALSAAFALVLLLTTPYEMGQDISYNTPGVAILQQANRYLRLDPTGAKIGLLALLALSVAVLVAPRFLRRGSAWFALLVAAGVIAWNLTGELAFASASNRTASRALDNIREPVTWVDDHTGGASTLYIGQQMKDQNGEWLLEFWNRSIKAVWSLDGTAQGPGPVLTPDPSASDGALSHDPGYPYVVQESGIEIAGTEVARHLHIAGGHLENWRLIRVKRPLRLRAAVTGLFADGWSGPESAYTRYTTEGNKTGRLRLVVSRKDWGGPNKTGHVTVKIGPIVIGDDKQPHVGMPMHVLTFDIHSKDERVLVLKAPGPGFRVEVAVDPTFAPIELSPQTTSDNRQLGAVIRYVFLPPRKAAHK